VPAVLPGKGLAQHDFFYAGEGKSGEMYIVRGGHVVWSYSDSTGKGEISDGTLLSNGNTLFAHQLSVTLITPARLAYLPCKQARPSLAFPGTFHSLVHLNYNHG
jgi:hypothetical protein